MVELSLTVPPDADLRRSTHDSEAAETAASRIPTETTLIVELLEMPALLADSNVTSIMSPSASSTTLVVPSSGVTSSMSA